MRGWDAEKSSGLGPVGLGFGLGFVAVFVLALG